MTQAGGLDPKALAVYRAMLRFPDLSDDELADKAEVDRAEFDVLVFELKRLGFVASYELPLAPVAARSALTPESAVARFAAIQSTRAAQVMSEVAAIAESLPDLVRDFEWGSQRASNLLELELVRGQGTNQRLFELIAQTKRDYSFVLNVQAPEQGLPHFPNQDEEPWLDLIARGGRVRVVVSAVVARKPEFWPHILEYLSSGQEYRLASGSMPPMMAIFDTTAALIALDAADTREGAIVVKSPSIVIALRHLFDDYWRTCTPPNPDSGSTDRKREILRLLSSGAKDEAIGRALGVGLRTIRREISDLMDEYGAGSRFQLGMLTERRAGGI